MPREKSNRKKKDKTVTETVIVQHNGFEWDVEEIRKRLIEDYVAAGYRWGRVREVPFYIKPEEHMVYYVINEATKGNFHI